MKINCGLFTNIAPLYTRPLWMELYSSDKVAYHFCSSARGFSGIKTISPEESRNVSRTGIFDWSFVKNIYFRDILIFQRGMIRLSLTTNHDIYIFNGEMYCISTWISALLLSLRRKKVLFWGHGLYGNERSIKKMIRMLFYRLADAHLVYNKRAGNLMNDAGISAGKIFCVYNSLDYRAHRKLIENTSESELAEIKSRLFPDNRNFPIIIFLGRLTRQKKLSYLLEAIDICRKRGNFYYCLIVGGGEESANLVKLSEDLGINELVNFYGPSYDEKTNLMLLRIADCCVSPGNVGLNAIHSMSAGTPVITHNNFCNQNPEVEAIIENVTGNFFRENDVNNLSQVIDELILTKKKMSMYENCLEQIEKLWNPVNQALLFDEAVIKSLR